MKDLACLAVVLAASALLFQPLLQAGFVIDDYHIIDFVTREADLDAGASFNNFARISRYFAVQANPRFQLYRPGVVLSFGLNLLTSGLDEFGWQLTTLSLHLLAGAVLFWLIRTHLPDAASLTIALAAGLFLTSPLQLEVASWSAARSDSLSFIFGALALIAKLRRPRRLIIPPLLVLASLTAKESALIFLPALVVIDLFGVGNGDERRMSGPAAIGRALRRSPGVIIVFASYCAIRLAVFGKLFGTYGHHGDNEFLNATQITANVFQTLSVLVAPVSELVFKDAWFRIPLMFVGTMGFLALVYQFMSNGKRRVGDITLCLTVLALPLLLSVLVNSATHKLVGTRALYTPFAAACWLLVLGAHVTPGFVFSRLPLVLIIVSTVPLSRACQRPHLDAHEDMSLTIASLRDPLERDGVRFDAVAVIGYHEAYYFDDSYTMASPIRAALRRPFLERNYELYKISCEAPSDVHEDYRTFADVMSGDTSRLAIFVLADLPPGRPRPIYTLATCGEIAAERGALVPLEPRPGATFDVRLGDSDSELPTFRFETRGFEAAKFTFTLFACDNWLPELTVPADQLPSFATEQGRVYAIVIPRTELDRHGPMVKPMVWLVTALDGEGRVLARTAPRLFLFDLHK